MRHGWIVMAALRMAIAVSPGSAGAGMWGNTQVMELPLLTLEGQIGSDEALAGPTDILFTGIVDLGDEVITRDPAFDVLVTPGGPDQGNIQLTLYGAFDVQARAGGPTDGYLRLTIHGVLEDVPGDRIHENGDCDLPTKWADSGVITMQLEASSIPPVIESVVDDSPEDFGLVQNYPNPINSSMVIRFSLTENTITHLAIYNTTSQKVATLIDGPREVGGYRLHWDGRARSLRSGPMAVSLPLGDIA